MKKPLSNYPFKMLLSLFALALMSFLPLNFTSNVVLMEEICDNGIDDDNDDLIDLNDPDCPCEKVEAISLIPNPSFEDINCCPSDHSQLGCADIWIQASEPTTDLIHKCDWMGWSQFPPPLPFPDGEGIMGFRDGRIRDGVLEANWKEYAGACLINPLEANQSYRIEFYLGFVNSERSPPINITIFGTTSCDNLPFGIGNENLGCPTNGPGWVNLGNTLVSGGTGDKWIRTAIELRPEEKITAIAIGPECRQIQSDVNLYYFFDSFFLANFNLFDLRISEVSHPCQADFSLEVAQNGFFSYQWFKGGIALLGETEPQLSQMYGEGAYAVRIEEGNSCRLSAEYSFAVPTFTSVASRTICNEDEYSFGNQLLSEEGVYTDTFKSTDNCDSTVTLNLKVLGLLADTIQARIFEGNTYEINNQKLTQEGEHLITLTSPNGCDSLIFLQLQHHKILIPSAFSPNGDGINDVFAITIENDFVEDVELRVFDRWGNEIFKGLEWDGQYYFRFVDIGAYVYLARVRMKDGAEQQFSGWLTVLK